MSFLHHKVISLFPQSESDKHYNVRSFLTACGVEFSTGNYESLLLKGIPRTSILDTDNNNDEEGKCKKCFPVEGD